MAGRLNGCERMEHPDIESAYNTGYATFQAPENSDCPEVRADYIDDHIIELVVWLKKKRPEILEEYISEHIDDYTYWLN